MTPTELLKRAKGVSLLPLPACRSSTTSSRDQSPPYLSLPVFPTLPTRVFPPTGSGNRLPPSGNREQRLRRQDHHQLSLERLRQRLRMVLITRSSPSELVSARKTMNG